jgi:hypothetical protein
MWSTKKNENTEKAGLEAPAKVRYSRYYEHDGALRAYANRAMLLAFLCVPATMLALGFAVYVRLQPPTVIRVDEDVKRLWLAREDRNCRSRKVQGPRQRNSSGAHSCACFLNVICPSLP